MPDSRDAATNLNKNKELPRISALPKGQTPWRIDWFGDIAFPDRTVRRNQPSIFLHLSRVADERFLQDPVALLAPESTALAKFQKPEEAQMPLVYMPYLPSRFEDFLLAGRNVRADVHEWLAARLPKGSRLN